MLGKSDRVVNVMRYGGSQSIFFFSLPAQAWVTGTASRHGRRGLVFFPAYSPPLHWAVSLLCVWERARESWDKSINLHISIGAEVQWLHLIWVSMMLKCRPREVKFTKYKSDGEHLEEGQKHKRHHSCVVIHQLKHIYPTLHTHTHTILFHYNQNED